jgi:hypothetical protein
VVEFQKNAGRAFHKKCRSKNGGKACTMYHALILAKALCGYRLELAGPVSVGVLVDSTFYRSTTTITRSYYCMLRGESPLIVCNKTIVTGWTTSSHLHVVSAGNSQRNSPAVSECREELKTRLSFINDASTRQNQPLNLTKHHTSQPQYARGSCAPFGYAHDGQRTWVPSCLA